MAGADRMTIEQVVRKVLVEDHADVIRESVRWVAEQLMEAEVSELVGAELGERKPDDRATHRNGYRPRRWDTRAGEIELQIPKLRQGSYFPSFLTPRKRSEQALVAVVQQAYVCGVSTRRVDQLVESLGLRISKSEVSRVCAGLDEQVQAFRTRPLEGRYPYLFVDAKVEKVRDGGRVARKCVVVAHAVHESGGGRSSAWISARRRPKRSGPSFCAAWSRVGWSGSSSRSQTPTKGSRPRWPRSSAWRGSGAPCTSSGTSEATSTKISTTRWAR
jgi:transposase-like protein